MIIVKRGSAGDDHSPEAVEIKEHTPLHEVSTILVYTIHNTHIAKLWCDVNNIQASTGVGCPMAHKISSNNTTLLCTD